MKRKNFWWLTAALMLVLTVVAVESCRTTQPSGTVADDSTYYVTNYASQTISVINGKSYEIERTIDLSDPAVTGIPADKGSDNQCHFLSVTRDEKYLWIGVRWWGVIVIDLNDNNKIVKRFVPGVDGIPDEQISQIAMYMTKDGKWLFTTGNNKIHIFNVADQTYLGNIAHGSMPHVFEETFDGKILWTADYGNNIVSYDISGLPAIPAAFLDKFNINDQIPGGRLNNNGVPHPNGTSSTATLHALVIHPSNKYLCIGSFQQGNIRTGSGTYVVDIGPGANRGKLIKHIPGRPHNFDLSPDGNTLLVCDNERALFNTGTDGNGVVGTKYFTQFSDYLDDLGFKTQNENPFLTYTIDLSTLNTSSPDMSSIKISNIYEFSSRGRFNHVMLSADKTKILVTADGSVGSNNEGTLRVLDANTLQEIKALDTGNQPHAIAIKGYTR
jgi:DNA-binding beta-propeller fold protein YncE